MRFVVNTKPLINALNLAIINANISSYHKKSNLVQITASKSDLRINVEASKIKTEVVLKGSGDVDSVESIFVSSSVFKQLINTIESSTVTIEYVEGGLNVISGNSKFTVAKQADASETSFDRPVPIGEAVGTKIDATNWKFIKDNQLYAAAMSFVYPVYTYVWMGGDDVLVSDFSNSLFTHSNKSCFNEACLISDTVVNLFTSLPEGAQMYKVDRDYLISFNADSFTYLTQLTPVYESDEGVGSYNSEVFLNMMKPLNDISISVSASQLAKYLSQSQLLSTAGTDAVVVFTISDNMLSISDDNVDCKIDIGSSKQHYTLKFNAELFRKVMSNYGEVDIRIAGYVPEDSDVVAGILVWDDNLTTLLAGLA